jgi:hypothetical protein
MEGRAVLAQQFLAAEKARVIQWLIRHRLPAELCLVSPEYYLKIRQAKVSHVSTGLFLQRRKAGGEAGLVTRSRVLV